MEVKEAFAKVIVKALNKGQQQDNYLYTLKNNVQQAFKLKDYAIAISEFNKIINNFLPNSTSKFNEALFVDVVTLCLAIANFRYVRENPTALGYSDLYFAVDDKLFVCEFKLATSMSQVVTKLKEAKEQLIDKKYANIITDKIIVKLAIIAINTKLNKRAKKEYCEIVCINEL